MVNKIEFAMQEEWNFDRDSVTFPAKVDGQYVRCMVSIEALMERFGSAPDHNDALRSFKSNRSSIEVIAAKMIELGKVEGGELLIKANDFGRQL